MSDEIMLVFGEDGVAREYDDAWDITIHCESEEEQKVVLEKLKNSNQEAKNSTESSLTQKELDTISRQANCDYCHEDSDGYVKPIEKNNHAFVRFGMDGWELSLKANGWHGNAKIRYCPMCGRDLFVK